MYDVIYTTTYSAYQYLLGQGWTDGHILGNLSPTQVSGTVPLYRFYHATWGHFFTTNYQEGINAGASFEYTDGYVWSGSGVRQVRRWHHPTYGCYKFTHDDGAQDDNSDWTDEGLKFRMHATQETGDVPLYCAYQVLP